MLSGTVRSSYEAENWQLHEEEGDDAITIYQAFTPAFSEPPTVVISFSELDAPAGPLRARVSAVEVTAAGFQAKIETWAGSRLYAATASWLAYEG
jgi:hypothetical protein